MKHTKTFQSVIGFESPAALMNDNAVEAEIDDACLCLKNLMHRWVEAERTGEPIRPGIVGEMVEIVKGKDIGGVGQVIAKRPTADATARPSGPLWCVSLAAGVVGWYSHDQLEVQA